VLIAVRSINFDSPVNLIFKIGLYVLKTVWFLSEFIFGFLLIYLDLVIAFSAIPVGGDELTDGIKIYVKSNGIHTDICLPVKNDQMDWQSFVPVSHYPKVKSFQYISIGWGDKGFFLDTPTWDDLTFTTAFTAAFLPSPTAMHVQYLETEPLVSESTKFEFVSPEKYSALVAFVCGSFDQSNEKVNLIENRGYWYNDNFYEAKGSYHLFNTCNAWTNEALKVAGVRTAWLALFSDGIMKYLN
jgi:uncharacterized protein (TIGR02117 family)